MPFNESGPDGGEMTLEEIREVAKAWLTEQGFSGAEVEPVVAVLSKHNTIEDLCLHGSFELAKIGSDVDLLELLRGIGAIEAEGEAIVLDQAPGSDEDPAETQRRVTQRAIKLLKYVLVVGDQEGIATEEAIKSLVALQHTSFLAENSEDFNLYTAAQRILAEQLQPGVEKRLVSEETWSKGRAPSKTRLRQLKKQAEEEALGEAKKIFAAQGILSPESK